MRTLEDLDVDGKRVLVRVDFNVPLDEDGHITDDARIRGALPTLTELQRRGARLLLAAHLGRPKDREPEFSLRPVAERLSELLDTEVALAEDLDHVPDGDVVMLENVRFEPGETKNDPELAKRYAALGGRVRERRVRCRPPRARLHRGGRSPAAERRRPAPWRGGDPSRHPRRPDAAVRRRGRRREGDRQDRRDRRVAGARRRDPDRRRDGVHLLPAQGTTSASRWSRRRASRPRARCSPQAATSSASALTSSPARVRRRHPVRAIDAVDVPDGRRCSTSGRHTVSSTPRP